ncbi:UDP-galactose transporter [Fusarium beomiforme]|uniref:UDP-galactose transporter n=1 Tax=Fusarium beomiforme TaxID=44412 RepID=A0A9P5AJX7_9HYPO|nr:UDP-galactose transporter [Fusarium beomiforme]
MSSNRFLRNISLRNSSPQQAAYLAALSLVGIQVGIGIIMKTAQRGGSYSFSASGSITISEFLKLLLSTVFFYRECKTRAQSGVGPCARGLDVAYSSLSTEHDDADIQDKDEAPSSLSLGSDDEEAMCAKSHSRPLAFSLRTFWDYAYAEVRSDVRFGFHNLALLYILINNSIFLSYKMADPGTIQLTKSGVTLITALVRMATLGQKLSKIQWMAITMQLSGLFVTQYQPGNGSLYPLDTYVLLLFQVFISATSGVYNESLLKADNSSLHAGNMILYASGTVVNLACHITIKCISSTEPGFFEGYGRIDAILVILSNVFIGLAITAVYKYADAIIKCFATAFSTGILLFVAPLISNTTLSFLVIPGTLIIFVASWLYMENPPAKPKNATPSPSTNNRFFSKLGAIAKKKSILFIFLNTFITVIAVVALAMYQVAIPANSLSTQADGNSTSAIKTPGVTTIMNEEADVPEIVTSPFKNSLAFIRWNSLHPERVPEIMKYKPFFRELHISMPEMMKDEGLSPESHNLTHDQSPLTFHIYVQVAHTMQLILDEHPDIDGLLYYHFDAWIDPLAWSNIDRNNMHFPMTWPGMRPTGPQFACMNDTKDYDWGGWADQNHMKAQLAAAQLDHLHLGYEIDIHEWCVGWSDIYFIPRKFFKDYIVLAPIFMSFSVFHEVGIPTMLHIIDMSYRKTSYIPAMELFADCWGYCCADNPTIYDVITYRCGHRLDYQNKEVTAAFYDKLEAETQLLGKPFNSSQVANLTEAFPPLKESDKLKLLARSTAEAASPTSV